MSQNQINNIEKAGVVYCADAKVLEPKRVAVTNLKGEQDFVIVLLIEYNKNLVVKNSKRNAYIRRGDERHKLTDNEIRLLAYDKGEINFETQSCKLEYPERFNLESISQWASNVRTIKNSGFELSDMEILENRMLGRIENGKFEPNIACALLFAKNPREVSPGCRVRIMRFDGNDVGVGEKYNETKRFVIEGTIPEIIVGASEALEAQLRTFSPLRDGDKGKRFYPTPEYPKTAWYEALVNACVHRSYGNGMKNVDTIVRVFDDHLDIESPGPLPPFVTPENIYEKHVP